MYEYIVDTFFADEATPRVRELLLTAINSSPSGVRPYFTFNAFNLLLDFDLNEATIEDEFDSDVAYVMSIDEFKARLDLTLE